MQNTNYQWELALAKEGLIMVVYNLHGRYLVDGYLFTIRENSLNNRGFSEMVLISEELKM